MLEPADEAEAVRPTDDFVWVKGGLGSALGGGRVAPRELANEPDQACDSGDAAARSTSQHKAGPEARTGRRTSRNAR
jgi:hypothetical protein